MRATDPTAGRRARIAVATAATGFAAGLAGVAVERRAPGYALVNGAAARALELAAGWALAACAVAAAAQGAHRFAWMVAAVIAWFAAAWDSPAAGSPLLFTAGLVAIAAGCPLAVRAALAHPLAGSSAPERRIAAAAIIAAVAIAGVASAAFTNPRAAGCTDCPRNLLLAHADPVVHDALRLAGAAAAATALSALAVVSALRLIGMEPAARATRGPLLIPVVVLAATSAVALAAAAAGAHPLQDGVGATGRVAQAVALLVLAAGIAWGGVRRRRARAAVARLVVEAAPRPGGLADALGRTLGDPDLRIAYPLADGRLVAIDGRPADATPAAGQAVTAIVGNGQVLAQLFHRSGLLEAPGLADDIAAAARLGLQHERLAAEVRARLADLRASRARIVAATDAERARLERNLHDGAQQQLVALMIDLRVARSTVAEPERAARLDAAAQEIFAAIDELRKLAGGLYPPALSDGGLAAALSALAEEAAVPIELGPLPRTRAAASAEAAAYFVAADLVRGAGPDGMAVAAGIDGDALWLELRGSSTGDRVALEDRVGALDGRLSMAATGDGRTLYRLELPCAS